MNYPQFIAIDASSFEEWAHPVAIAWSLPDGQIKTTLIAPDDDWSDDWDISLQDMHGITPETLHQRCETPWSVIRELEQDLEKSYIFADQPDRVEDLLVKLYESCSRELNFEIGHYNEQVDNGALDPYAHFQQPCDERVLQLLQAYARDN